MSVHRVPEAVNPFVKCKTCTKTPPAKENLATDKECWFRSAHAQAGCANGAKPKKG